MSISFERKQNRYRVKLRDGTSMTYSISKYGDLAKTMAEYSDATQEKIYNWFEDCGSYVKLFTFSKKENRQKEILVDKSDYEEVKKYYWGLNYHHGNIYAEAQRGEAGKDKVIIKMHRLVMGFPEGSDIDHKNKNGLDNRKRNLKVTSKQLNQTNKITLDSNNTGIIGVTRGKTSYRKNAKDCYRARISNLETKRDVTKTFPIENYKDELDAFIDAIEWREQKEIEFNYLSARYREEQRLYNVLYNRLKGMMFNE